MKLIYREVESPLGKVRVAANKDALVGLWFVGQKYESQPYHARPGIQWQCNDKDAFLNKVVIQLSAYFDGRNIAFDIPLSLGGTAFQQSVWNELLNIPSGQTITYGDLARRIGRPQAIRAAAAAVGRNPVSIIVPCHRVVGANGSLTGYAGGIDRKQKLLTLELSRLPEGEAA